MYGRMGQGKGLPSHTLRKAGQGWLMRPIESLRKLNLLFLRLKRLLKVLIKSIDKFEGFSSINYVLAKSCASNVALSYSYNDLMDGHFFEQLNMIYFSKITSVLFKS